MSILIILVIFIVVTYSKFQIKIAYQCDNKIFSYHLKICTIKNVCFQHKNMCRNPFLLLNKVWKENFLITIIFVSLRYTWSFRISANDIRLKLHFLGVLWNAQQIFQNRVNTFSIDEWHGCGCTTVVWYQTLLYVLMGKLHWIKYFDVPQM